MRSIKLTILVIITLVVTTMAAFGQDTPSDLRDLVGARAAGGETQLQSRGYENVKTETMPDSKMGYWWRRSSSTCVMVQTRNGRYASIASTAPVNCQGGNDMSSGGGSDTPSDLRDLVGARAAGGETQLRNRGYEFVKTSSGTDRKFSYWWHESKSACVSVSTYQARINAIVSTLPADCDRDPNAQASANDETPYDVRDLVGARAASGESQLRSRGYTFVKTEKGADRSFSNWWDRSNKICLNVVTIDGRYDTIMSVPPFDCNQTGDASSGNWKLISSTYAERGIRLHSAYILSKFDNISELKLKALNTPVKVWNMRIYYRNGRTQSVRLPNIISNLRESPAIQLEENGGIRMIAFSLNAVTIRDKKAFVWIYGK